MAKKQEKWFFRNLLKAIVLLAVLLITVQICLNVGTRHNKEITVPDFSGMPLSEAEHLAAVNEVRLDVTDSVSIKRLQRGAVFSQNPQPGSKVKKGRRILITINATSAQKVAMPNVVGLSLRQAMTELLSRGLKVGRLSYREDIASNNVLAQRIGGHEIAPGAMVETESSIDLTLGLDPNNPSTFVPYLLGFNAEVATEYIIESSLNLGRIRYDETVESYSDSLEAIVYMQSPTPGSNRPYPMGTSVDITLTKSHTKVASMKREIEAATDEEGDE